MTRLEKIELYFKMPFEKVISELHIKEKQSLLSLSNASGVGRDAFQKRCKELGLSLRGIKDARGLSALSGKDHWAFGLTKDTHEMYAKHSVRMKKNNPANNKKLRAKMSISLANTFRSRPLPQELIFKNILDDIGIRYIFQHPTEQYVIDFFLPDFALALEVDSTNKWGIDRRKNAAKRDKRLAKLGIKTLRFNKTKLDRNSICNILKANNVVF